MGRQHGTGRIYVKYGSYYGRWRTLDGRYVNRRLGKVRGRSEKDGLRAARPIGSCAGSWRQTRCVRPRALRSAGGRSMLPASADAEDRG